MHNISFAYNDSFTSSTPVGCLFFLTALSGTSNTILNKNYKRVSIHVFFLILEVKLSTLSIMLTVNLSYRTFLMLRYIPCITTLLSFYHLYIYYELCMAYKQKSH